ncbi:hypothetical protein CALCODRAFT_23755 [Calocera cornea HHB12733]|uniref:F-box domain-containing protein n=1 Tax=Calocera cornea HHB12733 TaxID=1353952 RepID=A0A165E4V4_9BASI|nr:hypothetical protein CALCODRAFT_23755 [Calocera cornea HHB12733]
MYLLPASKPFRSTYCAICGVSLRGRFSDERHLQGTVQRYKNLRPEDTAWLSNVRALRGWIPVDLGGLRVERSETGTYDAVQYFGSDVLLIGARVVPLYTASTVPVHDACSEIMLSLTTDQDVGCVWQSIQSRRALDGRRVEGCGLASQRQGIWWEEITGEEYMVTNPMKPLAFIFDSISVANTQAPTPHRWSPPNFFSRLPTELVLHILSFLVGHPRTLLALRHAVPFVLRLSTSAGNLFWNQVVLTEMEDFLPDIREILRRQESKDECSGFEIWRQLRADRGVRNRRRIAGLLIHARGFGDLGRS